MECLCIMHEAKPRGHLLLNGNPVEGDTLARMAGVSVDEARFLMDELQQAAMKLGEQAYGGQQPDPGATPGPHVGPGFGHGPAGGPEGPPPDEGPDVVDGEFREV